MGETKNSGLGELRLKIEKAIERTAGKKLALQEAAEGHGDFALPCFELAKEEKKNPQAIAEDFAKKIGGTVGGVALRAEAGYLNFYIDWKVFGQRLLESVDEKYGSLDVGKKALVEHTSINPNASPHLGRARNAIIGDSIVRVLRFVGYSVEVHYFVNDVGKQTAILVYGCSKKGAEKLEFSEMLKIYSETSAEIEKNPEMEKEIFKLLSDFEKGDGKTMQMFRDIVRLCVEGQKKILSDVNINYDYFDYESAYLINKRTDEILKLLEKTGKLFLDEEKRRLLNLKDFGLGYLVLTRSDGTSLYPLRDIAYTIDKIKRNADMNVLVLGEDHKLYFEQISAALRLLGYEPPKIVHYSYVLLPEGKMSTRKGSVVLLEDFMKEAYENALEEIEKRYQLDKEEKQKKARMISVAAVRYNIIKVSPEKNVMFNLSEALKFEGDTGPYLQYTYARANSIIEKAEGIKKFDAGFLKEKQETAILRLLAKYPSIIERCVQELRPHHLAEYLHQIADSFNSFYQNIRVLNAEKDLRNARLKLVEATRTVLKSGLQLLGIEPLERM